MEVESSVFKFETFAYPLIIRSLGRGDVVAHTELRYAALASLKWHKKLDGKFHCTPLCSTIIEFDDQLVKAVEIISTIPPRIVKNYGNKDLSDSRSVALHNLWKAMLPEDFKVVSEQMDKGEYNYRINVKISIIMKVSENGIEYETVKYD